MPGLYVSTANVTVPDSDLIGLYQPGSNIAFLNDAGTLLSILDNSGNVNFRASPGGTTVNAYVTFAAYTNANVAAYLPTNSTITGIQATSAGIQTGLNSANATISSLGGTVNTINYEVTTINNSLVYIQSEITALQTYTYSNSNVAAYLASNTDSTILAIQSNVLTLQSGYSGLLTTTSGLQNGLNTANASINVLNNNYNTANTTLNTLTSIVYGVQSGLNTANANIAGVQTGLNTSNNIVSSQGILISNLSGTVNNNTSNITTLQGQVYANSNVAIYLPTHTGQIGGTLTTPTQTAITSVGTLAGLTTSGNINTTNVIATAFYGSGAGLSNLPVQSGTYSNTNVASYLSNFSGTLGTDITVTGNLTVLGNAIITNTEYVTQQEIVAGTIIANANIAATNTTSGSLQVRGGVGITGNIYATGFWGDGSGLTNINAGQIAGSYGNANVAQYLVSYTGNVGTGTGFFFGNGYALTGLFYNSTIQNIQTALNTGNTTTSGLQTGLNTSNSVVSSIQTGLNTANSAISNNADAITVLQGNATTQQGLLNGLQTGLNSTNAIIATNGPILAGIQTGLNTANTNISGLQTGLNSSNTIVSGHTTSISNLQTGLNTANSSITTLQGQVYSNANLIAYMPNYAGNLSPAQLNASGNVSSNFYYGNGYYLTGIGLENTTTGYYGEFYDTTIQTNTGATNRNLIAIAGTYANSGIYLTNGGTITFPYVGTYQILYNLQFTKTSGGYDDVTVWVNQNGTDVPNSGTIVTVAGNPGKTLASGVHNVVATTANTTVQFYWYSGDTTMSITSTAAGTSPTRPATAGVDIAVFQVTSVQLPNGNVTLVGDIAGSGLLGSSITTTLSDTGVAPGTYGNAINIPQITVNSKGRITSITNITTNGYSNATTAAYLASGLDTTINGILTSITTGNTTTSGLQTGLNSANTTISGIQTGLNTANGTISTHTGQIATLQSQVYSNTNVYNYLSNYDGTLFHNLTISGNLVVSGTTTTVNSTIVNQDEIVAGLLTANANIASVSTGTGSLLVRGGAGVTGNVYATAFYGSGATLSGIPSTTDITGLQTGLNTANTTISNIQTGLNTANTNISGLQTGLNTANATIAGHTTALNTANTNISGLQTGLNTANSTIATHTTQITTLQGQVYTNTNTAAYLTSATINTTGNIQGVYILGNGSQLTNLPVQSGTYSNTNTAAYLTSASISTSGTLATTTGNITAGNYFIGNGSQLTNLPVQPGTYSNTNVASYYAVSSISTSGTIATTGTANITAGGYFIGNGSQLTGIAAGAVLTNSTTTFGPGTAAATLTSNGAYDLTLNTNSGTNAGVITLTNGVNGSISITPNGTGSTVIKNSLMTEKIFAIGTTGGAITPTWTNGSIQTITLNSNLTLNSITGISAGQTLTLIITQDATGSRTLTSTMKWAGAVKTLSTAANSVDIASIYYNGTTYYASLSTGFA